MVWPFKEQWAKVFSGILKEICVSVKAEVETQNHLKNWRIEGNLQVWG